MKYILAFIGAVIVAGAIYGAYLYPQVSQLAGSPVGTTFNTDKVAAVDMSPLTANATTTYLYNSDASDRIITDGFGSCGGVGTSGAAQGGAGGLAALVITMGTSSVGTGNLPTTLAGTFTIATSAPEAYTATTTFTQVAARRWPSATYLGISFNATNTAACIVGVKYLAS
jgi:hypothetical protein